MCGRCDRSKRALLKCVRRQIQMEVSEEGPLVSTWLGELQISQSEMNVIVMDYLLIEGYKEAAEKFREEAGLTNFPPLETEEEFQRRMEVKAAVGDGRIPEAIHLINSFLPQLLDDDRYLHFLLLQQELIELIRKKKHEEALAFAQDRLAEKGEEDPRVLVELERTLALLVFDQPELSPFGDLLLESHRRKWEELSLCNAKIRKIFQIASVVNAAILKASNKQSVPRIERLSQMVLWSQDMLDQKGVHYAKMSDIGTGSLATAKVKRGSHSHSHQLHPPR